MTQVELDSEVRDALRSEIALVFSQAPGILRLRVRLRAYLFERCEGRSIEEAVVLVRREIGVDRNDAAVLAEYLEIMVDQGWLYRDREGKLCWGLDWYDPDLPPLAD
ncbi:MAG: hypothetical protein AB1665_01645 [Candidatus Thermoplasmatota archaeon]